MTGNLIIIFRKQNLRDPLAAYDIEKWCVKDYSWRLLWDERLCVKGYSWRILWAIVDYSCSYKVIS